MPLRVFILKLTLLLVLCTMEVDAQDSQEKQAVSQFLNYFYGDTKTRANSYDYINQNWDNSYTVLALEVIYLSKNGQASVKLLNLLKHKTGQNFGYSFDHWYQWIWDQEENVPDIYADFKALLYKSIDPKFEHYFKNRYKNNIRLDEVRWGGVLQDGIPPLRDPTMIPAKDQQYLADDDIVFGIELNGDARAYPKRILAWHEMFVDDVGGIPVAGVYCTLCGTMVLYKTIHNGVQYEIGTSGFLYRSNKLMYDKATQSLWNTIWGTPVIGPLRGKGIELETLSVVTTTWGEWRKRHPDTQVLSLATGHKRNYSEGIAYQDYFATDELMFNTPFNDRRLKNKQEVLALRFSEVSDKQLAISTKFLRKNTLFQTSLENIDFVVFTDRSGGNRVYRTNGQKFTTYDRDYSITDSNGEKWILEENKIVSQSGETLQRLPYHRSFWFGWLAAYPNTQLIK